MAFLSDWGELNSSFNEQDVLNSLDEVLPILINLSDLNKTCHPELAPSFPFEGLS